MTPIAFRDRDEREEWHDFTKGMAKVYGTLLHDFILYADLASKEVAGK
jgi:hypothetical protein